MGTEHLKGPHSQRAINLITRAARKEGVRPALLYGLYGAESDFGRNQGPSSTGAQGWFQFEPSTAASYGINPHNFRQSVFAAAKYLGAYKDRGEAGMLGAYNAGPGIAPQNWVPETRAYIPKVLGLAKTFPGAQNGGRPAAGAHPTAFGGAGRTVLIGDSLGVGTLPFLKRALGGHIAANVKVGRSSADGIAHLQQLLKGGASRIVLDLGTNDQSARQLATSISRAKRLAPDTPIYALTVNGPDAQRKNAVLAKLGVHVIDWAGASGKLVGADGIHAASAHGYAVRGRLIASALKGGADTQAPAQGAPSAAAAPQGGSASPIEMARYQFLANFLSTQPGYGPENPIVALLNQKAGVTADAPTATSQALAALPAYQPHTTKFSPMKIPGLNVGGKDAMHLPKGTAPHQLVQRKGTADFEGTTVAAWIAPVLKYARRHGWKGTLSSGFRSFEDQTRLWNARASNPNPVAAPGTSNHEGDVFPRGAVDVGDLEQAKQLSAILAGSRYKKLLVYAGSDDPVHFSHPHQGHY